MGSVTITVTLNDMCMIKKDDMFLKFCDKTLVIGIINPKIHKSNYFSDESITLAKLII